MNRWLAIANYVYQFLVFIYPLEFRRRYGAEMASVFEDNCADAYRKGPIALVRVWCASVYDLLVSVFAVHSSRFLRNLKSDLRLVSKSPILAAALGAVAGNLFFIQEVVFGPPFEIRKRVQERLSVLGAASINIAVLWLASVLISQLAVYNVSETQISMKDRLRAFRRLAGIATLLSLSIAATLLISEDALPNASIITVPAISCWVGFPVLLLTIISVVFLLQPVLTLRSSDSEKRISRQSVG